MQAVLVKNDAWDYVSGRRVKPEIVAGDAASVTAAQAWIDKDDKAKSDLILAIHSSELKQIKGCETSRDVWVKLENIYQSKGPARKATLLKQLTLHKMKDGDDIREHARRFFDAVDKLSEMDVQINPDLLAIMLLYSLPPNFENFCCAIESRRPPNAENITHQNHRGKRRKKECRHRRGTRRVNNRKERTLEEDAGFQDQSKRT